MPITDGLIFMRHSLPVFDPLIPAREWHLSEEGRQRCRLLAGRLTEFTPRRIVSSLEPKALETARIVAETLGIVYEGAEGLHEHVRSQAEYAHQNEFEASVKEFFKHPDQLVFGDETADQAHARFTQALEGLQKRHPIQTPLVIITHGTVIALYVAHAYGIEPFPLWKSLKLPCIVEFSSREPRMISIESPHSYCLLPDHSSPLSL